ncbi:MAG: hypothetical protein R3D26_18315 [Cyanobacteriota/Melainabacteria group bacterium]
MLVEFGLITDDLLEQALSEAKEYGIPLGRVLVMSGWLTQKQINCFDSATVFTEGRIDLSCHSVAGSGSNHRVQHEPGSSPGDHRLRKALTSRNTRLGDLLVDAEIISS